MRRLHCSTCHGRCGAVRSASAARGRRLVARRDLVAGVAGVEGLGRGVGRPGVGALEPARRAGEVGDLLDDAGELAGDEAPGGTSWTTTDPAPTRAPSPTSSTALVPMARGRSPDPIEAKLGELQATTR